MPGCVLGCWLWLFSICLLCLHGWKSGVPLVGSTALHGATHPETLLGHRARAGLQRGWDSPLHMEKSLITLSSTTANLIGKDKSNLSPEFPKGEVPVGLRDPCRAVRAGISSTGPRSTSQDTAGSPLPKGVHAQGTGHQDGPESICLHEEAYLSCTWAKVNDEHKSDVHTFPFLPKAWLYLELQGFMVD